MINIKLNGLSDAVAALNELPAKLRKGPIRPALRKAARLVQIEIRRRTPVLKRTTFGGASALRRGVRKVGTVQRAVSVRTSRLATRQGDVGVFVNVKPLKGGGANNPNDPYYWRWIDKGWNPARSSVSKRERRALNRRNAPKIKPGAFFMRAGASKLPDAARVFEQELGPAVQRFQARRR